MHPWSDYSTEILQKGAFKIFITEDKVSYFSLLPKFLLIYIFADKIRYTMNFGDLRMNLFN